MVKAVIFDFYNTLAETTAVRAVVGGARRRARLRPPGRRPRALVERRHRRHRARRALGVARPLRRLAAVAGAVDAGRCGMPADVQDVFIERVREISGHNRIDAYDEVDERAARAAGPRASRSRSARTGTGICTRPSTSAGLTGAFDVVVSSAWVGARKPHPRIYAHTLDQLGIAPEDALFVGDTWTCDVDGPRAAGMRAVYLRRTHLGVDHTAPEHRTSTTGPTSTCTTPPTCARGRGAADRLSRRAARPRHRCRRGSRGRAAAARRAAHELGDRVLVDRVGDRDLDLAVDPAQRQRGQAPRVGLGEQRAASCGRTRPVSRSTTCMRSCSASSSTRSRSVIRPRSTRICPSGPPVLGLARQRVLAARTRR